MTASTLKLEAPDILSSEVYVCLSSAFWTPLKKIYGRYIMAQRPWISREVKNTFNIVDGDAYELNKGVM